MPARVIRGEINSSDSLSQVSLEADLTFRALIVAVDDFGRIDGRLPVLKGILFPLREKATVKKIGEWLAELASIENPPITLYEVDGKPFLQLTGWEEHRGKSRRGSRSKYPEPLPRSSADPQENHSDPPESRSRESRVGSEIGEPPSANLSVGEAPPPKPKAKKPAATAKTLCPDRLGDDQKTKLRAWSKSKGFTESELVWAFNTVKDWSHSNSERRADWVAATRNGMRLGWALKGYTESPEEKYQRELAASPLAPVNGGALNG